MTSRNAMPSGFHDTSLVGAAQNGSTICLSVECYTRDDVEESVKALIYGVETIIRDDAPISGFRMETDYASIIMLEPEGKDIVLLLKWIDFHSKTDITNFYRMRGSNIGISID